ncbi:hypothetical protein BC628DRAFT_1475283 [Trametes gibbosa]|nr:hypothetical protein BC628DRAFT_1475283 [Trametes gibbosa]
MKRKRSPEEPSDDEEDEEDDQISDDDKDVEPRRQQRKRIAVGNNNDEDEDMEIDNELGQAKQSDNSEASRGMKLSLHEVALPADAPEPSQTGPEWFQAKDADREAVISSYEDAFTAGANRTFKLETIKSYRCSKACTRPLEKTRSTGTWPWRS